MTGIIRNPQETTGILSHKVGPIFPTVPDGSFQSYSHRKWWAKMTHHLFTYPRATFNRRFLTHLTRDLTVFAIAFSLGSIAGLASIYLAPFGNPSGIAVPR